MNTSDIGIMAKVGLFDLKRLKVPAQDRSIRRPRVQKQAIVGYRQSFHSTRVLFQRSQTFVRLQAPLSNMRIRRAGVQAVSDHQKTLYKIGVALEGSHAFTRLQTIIPKGLSLSFLFFSSSIKAVYLGIPLFDGLVPRSGPQVVALMR